MLFLIVEHGVLMFRFAMGSFLPTTPEWLQTAKETLQFKMAFFEEAADGSSQDHKSVESALRVKRRMGADHPEEVFDEMDGDGDGLLSAEEIGRCCKRMGMNITDQQELMEIVAQIDGDGDQFVDQEEFASWWQENGGKNKFQLRDPGPTFRQHDKDGSGALDVSEMLAVCNQLGMVGLSDKQKDLLMQELDVDGDGTVDEEEFGMWWQENGGAKFRPRAPPGPGDMSRRKRFELRKAENARSKSADAGLAVADSMAHLDQLLGDDDNNKDDGYDYDDSLPPSPARRPPPPISATFEIEESQQQQQQQQQSEMHTSNPLAADAPAQRNGNGAAGAGGWASLRTGQQQHSLFDGQSDATHIARRAAAILKPPLQLDHTKMTRREVQRAQHGAALDRRVERLLMGDGAEISHSHDDAAAGASATAATASSQFSLPLGNGARAGAAAAAFGGRQPFRAAAAAAVATAPAVSWPRGPSLGAAGPTRRDVRAGAGGARAATQAAPPVRRRPPAIVRSGPLDGYGAAAAAAQGGRGRPSAASLTSMHHSDAAAEVAGACAAL